MYSNGVGSMQSTGRYFFAACIGVTKLLVIALTSCATSPAPGQTVELVAATGDQAPGTPEGAVFGALVSPAFGAPVLDDYGNVAFAATLLPLQGGVDFTNDLGIWHRDALVTRTGSQAPDTPPATVFGGLDLHTFNGGGATAYIGFLNHGVGGVDASNDRGIWQGSTLLARSGSRAHGLPANVPFEGFFNPRVSYLDHVAYAASLRESATNMVTPANDRGIWVDYALIAREGSQAPGLPSGVNFKQLTDLPVVDLAGDAYFRGTLQTDTPHVGLNLNDTGIWTESTLLVRTSDQAPGTPAGVAFSGLSDPSVGYGRYAFLGALRNNTGPAEFTSTSGIWVNDQALVLQGTQAPGTPDGVVYQYFNPPVVSAYYTGFTGFLVHDTAHGVDSTNDSGIWRESLNGLSLVAREGSPAPGTDGANFDEMLPFDMGALGQVAFLGALQHGGDVDFSNDSGIWAQDQSGELRLIAREGDPLDVGGGEVRIVKELRFATDTGLAFLPGSGGVDGRRTGFNSRGQVAFAASFTDNTHGIFVVTPEPPAEGEDFVWSGGCGNSNWHSPCLGSNWVDSISNPTNMPPGDVPGTENVFINDAAVTLTDRPADVRMLQATGELLVNERLFVREDSSIENLTVGPTLMAAQSSLSLSGDSMVGAILSQGMLSVANKLDLRDGSLQISGGSTVSAGTLQVASGTTADVNGSIHVAAGSTLVVATQLHLGAGAANNVMSSITVDGGRLIVGGDIHIADGAGANQHASITLTNGAEFDTAGPVDRVFVGGMTAGNSGHLNIQGGTMGYTDELHVNATGEVNLVLGSMRTEFIFLRTGGKFNFTGGTLTFWEFDGDLTQQNGTLTENNHFVSTYIGGTYNVQGGNVAIEIDSPGQGIGRDHVIAQDVVIQSGVTLDITLGGGFVPVAGDVFKPVDSMNGLVGEFDTVNLPSLDPGLFWLVNYDSNSIILEVIANTQGLPGDFNDDGIVNVADYVVWRNNLGAADESAIANNGDGVNGVNANDYQIWRDNFGAMVVSSASQPNAPVPEPSGLGLILVALIVGISRGHCDARLRSRA